MKKKATVVATLVAAASLASAATVSAHAYPALQLQHEVGHQSSKVASVRLHALLDAPASAERLTNVRPNGWGSGLH
jgi:hypothetical protein